VTRMRTGKFNTTNLRLVHELVLGRSELFLRGSGMVLSQSSVSTSGSQTRHSLKHSRMKLQCYGVLRVDDICSSVCWKFYQQLKFPNQSYLANLMDDA